MSAIPLAITLPGLKLSITLKVMEYDGNVPPLILNKKWTNIVFIKSLSQNSIFEKKKTLNI